MNLQMLTIVAGGGWVQEPRLVKVRCRLSLLVVAMLLPITWVGFQYYTAGSWQVVCLSVFALQAIAVLMTIILGIFEKPMKDEFGKINPDHDIEKCW